MLRRFILCITASFLIASIAGAQDIGGSTYVSALIEVTETKTVYPSKGHVDQLSAQIASNDKTPTEKSYRENDAKNFLSGIFIAVTIFNIVFFFCLNRRLGFLLLSTYCFIQVIKISLVYSVDYATDIGTADYDLRVLKMYLSAYAGSFLLLLFFLVNFSIPRHKTWMLILLSATVVCYGLQLKGLYLSATAGGAFFVSSYAIYKKYPGGMYSFVGVSGYALLTFMGNKEVIEYGYFIGILFLVVCLTLSFVIEVIDKNNAYQAAVLRSSRLENELLKKNIQPHFVMNSLMSLQELLVKNAADAGEFIDALADEFRLFSAVSGKKLIDIKEELELCEAHLKVMGWRKNTIFSLDIQGLNGSEKIPPGVLHTLVENGITHGYEKKQQGYFVLSKEILDFGVRYSMFNDSQYSIQQKSNGMGLQYVESRLQESYLDRWQVASFAVEGGWKVVIDIHEKSIKKRRH